MKNKRSNWQAAVFVILIFAVWFGALPVYTQTKQDGKGVGVKVLSELPSKEKRWALLVGIDEYQNDVSTLKGSVNDARALKNVLVSNAGFPENQIVLLTTDSNEPDKRPTRENILGALSDLYSRVPEDGLLLFSFSGHGISVGSQAFLIPSNGRFTKNPELLQDFSIDVSRIKRAIETMKVKQVLMLLDACRNEPGKGDVPNRLTDAYKNGFSFDVANSDVKAFATLYATSIGERAFEFLDKDTKQFRGYFSHAVEEALKGKAANEKGEVTLSRLIDYLETTIPKKVKYDKGETQIPTANYSETYRANQLILAVAKPTILGKTDQTFILNTTANKIENNSIFVNDNELVPAEGSNGKWGYINEKTKKIVIALKYDYAWGFTDGLAEVELKGKKGVIDIKGNEIIPIKYESVGPLHEGLMYARLKEKIGFINKNNEVVIPFKYDDTTSFIEGIAVSKLNGKWGFINKMDKPVIPFLYDYAQVFVEATAKVELGKRKFYIDRNGNEVHVALSNIENNVSEADNIELTDFEDANGKWGFKDNNGAIVIEPKYDSTGSFRQGLASVKIDGKIGYINKKGSLVIQPKYDEGSSFYDGVAEVKLNSKVGIIDKSGKEIVPIKYDFVSLFFKEDLFHVKLGEKYSFVDAEGKEVIPLKYDDVWHFSEGLAPVKLDGKWGFIDKTNKIVIPFKYDGAFYFTDSSGLVAVKLNGKEGFINHKGEAIIPLKYDDVTYFHNNYAAVKLGSKWGFVNKNGKEIVPIKYDEVDSFSMYGKAKVKLNGREFYIDESGNEVSP